MMLMLATTSDVASSPPIHRSRVTAQQASVRPIATRTATISALANPAGSTWLASATSSTNAAARRVGWTTQRGAGVEGSVIAG
jgi:hypothetical protein